MMGNSHCNSARTKEVKKIPPFLSERVSHYYEHRVKTLWGGSRSLMGIPKTGDVALFSNDYLSISNHPDITDAQIHSLKRFGNGPMMSQVFFSDASPQKQFEKRMAQFMHAKAVLVCQSGWCANTGLLQAIANKDTSVYLDIMAHMSLWEGVTSAGAKAYPFRHNRAAHLEHLLKQNGPGIVVVDSIYSTNGSVCCLRDIVELAHAHGCIIVVDESHSLGTHGPSGAGMVVEQGLTDKVHFRTSSLGKAFSGRGGVIAGSKELIQYIEHEAQPMIFSSAVLPTDIALFNASLNVIQTDEWRRDKMRKNADYLREGLTDMGYNVSDSGSQIISLAPGPEQNTLLLRDALEAKGVFGAIFFPPATPKNHTLLRFCASTQLTLDKLEHTLNACAAICDQVGMKHWGSTRQLVRKLA